MRSIFLTILRALTDLAWHAIGMSSPLIGIAGVNSLLFASNNYARKLVSPFPDLSIPQVMLAGSMAGAVQSVLASPVEMFKASRTRVQLVRPLADFPLSSKLGSNASESVNKPERASTGSRRDV